MVAELGRDPLERDLRVVELPLRRERVRVEEERPCAPRGATRGHALKQQVRRARELAQIARAVPRHLEHAEGGLHHLGVPGCREDDGAGAVAAGGVAIEHDLEVGRCGARAILLEESHARQVGGRGRLGLERVAGHDRLVAAGGVGMAAHGVERACHAVLGAGRDRVLEVAREHLVELDDRLRVVALVGERLPDQELRPGCDVGSGPPRDDTAQENECRIRRAREQHRTRGPQFRFCANAIVLGARRDAGELFRGALVLVCGEERVRLGEARGIAQRRIGPAVGHVLEPGRGLQERALLAQGQRAHVRRRRLLRMVADRGDGVRRPVLEQRRERAREPGARIAREPWRACLEQVERAAGRGGVAAPERVPRERELGAGNERARGEALLPARPLLRGLGVVAGRLHRLDGRERGVAGEGSGRPGSLGVPERIGRRAEVAQVATDRAEQEFRRGATVVRESAVERARQRGLGLLERVESRRAGEQPAGLVAIAGLAERRGRVGTARRCGSTGGEYQHEHDWRRESGPGGGHWAGPQLWSGVETTGTSPRGPPVEISSVRSWLASRRPAPSVTASR